MHKPHKRLFEPIERNETIRRHIIALLQDYTISSKELSGFLKIPEKDVHDHLGHIRKTINKGDFHLIIKPARCEKCNFVFRKRDRFAKPGKCPICRSNQIIPPLYSISKHS